MKKALFVALLVVGVLTACHQKDNQTKTEDNMQKLELTQEWDKVFPLSDKVNHCKVTFETQYGLTLAADLYVPKDARLEPQRSSRADSTRCTWQSVAL